MNKYLLTFIFCLVSFDIFAASLKIENAWMREAPPTAKNLAGYVELHNPGSKTVTITSATSNTFKRVEIHVTSFENGMMRMKEMKTLKINPGETVYFEPGGKHFMLIKPKVAIKAGLNIPVILSFDSNKKQTINFLVRK